MDKKAKQTKNYVSVRDDTVVYTLRFDTEEEAKTAIEFLWESISIDRIMFCARSAWERVVIYI